MTGKEGPAAVSRATHHWREYPVGFAGELARMFAQTLLPFGVSLLLTFGLILVVGIMNEEGLIQDATRALGLDEVSREVIATGLGYLLRMALVPLLIVGYLAGLGACIALCVRDITASTALVEAAGSGAPRAAVPHPNQVESVVKRRFLPLWMLLIISTGSAAFFAVILGIFALVEGFSDGLTAAVVLVAVTVVCGLGFLLVHLVLEPSHHKRREVIASRWRYEDEQAAWNAAREVPTETSPGSPALRRDPRVVKGTGILNTSTRLGVFAMMLLYVLMFVTHPYATTGSNPDAGPRVNYPEQVETVLTVSFWVMATLTVACVVGAGVGHLIEGLGRRAERHALTEVAGDPRATRPHPVILDDYGQRGPVRLAQALAMLSGIGIVVGPAALLLSTFRSDNFPNGVALFTSFRGAALVTVVVAVVLFVVACGWNAIANVRAVGIRNELMLRWPSMPSNPKDSDGNEIPARVGPALSVDPRVR